ncbi:(2,3-dihydroxybenzoyl)adenylate synthase [Streptomyces prunicolor]|uniref:(2,3-dihydroxybenzoyl)adenylate synthase n=1 Tax=Streptomyces prunicolor TaxID=67348 RepID=UPI003713A87B
MLSGCPAWPQEFAHRYRQAGYWGTDTLGSVLRGQAGRHGEKTAVVCGTRRLSYAELDHRADSLATGLLRLGVRKDDRVVVQLPNTAEFHDVCFALFRIGAVPVMALPALRSSEISHLCASTEAVAYVVAASHGGFDYLDLADQVRSVVPEMKWVLAIGSGAGDAGRCLPLEELYDEPEPPGDGPGPHDVALLQLSGGTTALPKLIPRTHADYLYTARACAEAADFGARSVYLAALPMAHNFPLVSPGVLGAVAVGATCVLAPLPSPDVVFPLIAEERVTHTSVVPPLALIWLESASRRYDLSSLRVLQVGGAKCSAEVAKRIRPTLGCTLQQAFGMAEGLINFTRLDDPEEVVVHTQGRPISPGDEIRVVDTSGHDVPAGETGELLARGPYTVRGYYRADEHNARTFTDDGFYRTGDLVRLRPDGNLVVEGRAKDQINRGGEKIAAEEVENHLLAHPGVHDAAVVAVPDLFLGERSCAYVIPRGPGPSAAELTVFLKSRGIAAYKVPDRIEFVDAFPLTGVGKVSKKHLRSAPAAP